jgi:hypothetical protein
MRDRKQMWVVMPPHGGPTGVQMRCILKMESSPAQSMAGQ